MSTGWENNEPAPIEYFHGRLIDRFHEWREAHTQGISITISGSELNNIIAKAKGDTYAKYPKQDLGKVIPKSEM